METKVQVLIVCIVGALGVIALLGMIALSFAGKNAPLVLGYIGTGVISGLCGALAPGAIKSLHQQITGDNPAVVDVTAPKSEG